MKRLLAVTAFVLGTAALPALAGAAAGDAAAPLEKTGVKGGLCLVLGAKDPALVDQLHVIPSVELQEAA